jgi:hypothetical protein
MAEAELFYVNGTDHKSPFQRIVERARSTKAAANPERLWLLPQFDAILNGPEAPPINVPEVQPVLTGGASLSTAEYSWSITVAYPYDAVVAADPTKLGNVSYVPRYLLNDLWQNDQVFVVQVTVYRKASPVAARGNLKRTWDSTNNVWTLPIVIEGITTTGSALQSVRSGDWVRYLDPPTSVDPALAPLSDGFWYQVDQVDAAGQRVKLSEKYWGLAGNNASLNGPLEFTDRIIGTYTFLLSAE